VAANKLRALFQAITIQGIEPPVTRDGWPVQNDCSCVAASRQQHQLNGVARQYVAEFKYLGHIISNDNADDKDVLRLLFTRANIRNCRFGLYLACVLYPSKLLCFGLFVFVFMGWHCGRNIMQGPLIDYAQVILSV